tara:strand:- start:399 stop:509 length:111 start_codon:yes stop_codon:yes gene_type:complete
VELFYLPQQVVVAEVFILTELVLLVVQEAVQVQLVL